MVILLLVSAALAAAQKLTPCATYYPADAESGDWVCMAPGRSMGACHDQGLGRPTGVFNLAMQQDSNLVMYRSSDGFVKWASNTMNTKGERPQDTTFFYSPDGNTGIFSGGIVVNAASQKLGNTWGSNGLLCLDVMNGVLTLFNAGQSSLTNPIWTSTANNGAGGFVMNGYPSSPARPGPAAIIPAPPPPPPPTADPTTTTAEVIVPTTSTLTGFAVMTPAVALPGLAPSTTTPTKSDTTSLSTGAIAGIATGAAVLVLILGGIIYTYSRNRRNRQEQFGIYATDVHLNTVVSPPAFASHKFEKLDDSRSTTSKVSSSNSVGRLPSYANAPAAAAVAAANVVTAVPGFYRAITDHHAVVEGELSFSEHSRIYVVSQPDRHGWCRGRVGGEEGWIRVEHLGLLG